MNAQLPLERNARVYAGHPLFFQSWDEFIAAAQSRTHILHNWQPLFSMLPEKEIRPNEVIRVSFDADPPVVEVIPTARTVLSRFLLAVVVIVAIIALWP